MIIINLIKESLKMYNESLFLPKMLDFRWKVTMSVCQLDGRSVGPQRVLYKCYAVVSVFMFFLLLLLYISSTYIKLVHFFGGGGRGGGAVLWVL